MEIVYQRLVAANYMMLIWQLPQKILISYCVWMKIFFSFIHGNCLILYFIPLWQVFHSLFHYFILLWHVFHLLSHSCPGLFHSLSHSSVASFSFIISFLPWIISFNISFLCGRFFIHHLILTLVPFGIFGVWWDQFEIVKRGPVRSSFFAFFGWTATATGCLVWKYNKNRTKTAKNHQKLVWTSSNQFFTFSVITGSYWLKVTKNKYFSGWNYSM